MARKEIPLSEVLPQPAGGVDTGLKPPVPPHNIGITLVYISCYQALLIIMV